MSTVINTHVVGGLYSFKKRAYRVVYVWPTGDVSVIWDGETMATMEALGAPTITISLPDQPAAEPAAGTENTDQEAGEGVAVVDVDQDQADTDKEAVAKMDGNQLVGLVIDGLFQQPADADKEAATAEPASPQEETPEVTSARIGMGKAVHRIVRNAEGYVTSKCGQTGRATSSALEVTCKRCLKN